jgi:hypothetical protein
MYYKCIWLYVIEYIILCIPTIIALKLFSHEYAAINKIINSYSGHIILSECLFKHKYVGSAFSVCGGWGE